MRYRLRLGPFATEDQAIAVLDTVRRTYPTALTATADADDLRTIASAAAKVSARVPVQKTAVPPPSGAKARVAPTTAARPTVTATPAAPSAARRGKPAAPIAAAKQVPPVAGSKQAAPAAAPKQAPPVAAPKQAAPKIEESGAPHWYAIQLAQSERPFSVDALPKLDIFSLYRLYSVAGLEQGRTTYGLRLGFFSDESAAAAVAKYLTGHYDHAAVTRVSVAERERFAVQLAKARRNGGAV